MTDTIARPSPATRVAAIFATAAIALWWAPAWWRQIYFGIRGHDESAELWGAVALLTLAVLLTVWIPRTAGLTLGRVARHPRFTLVFMLLLTVPLIVGMLFIRTPFYAGTRVTYLLVPLYEELLFRGFVWATLAAAFPWRRQLGPIPLSAATLISGVAFGVWHLGGAVWDVSGFVALQLVYTTLGGWLSGILRDKTGTLWPGWLAHVMVNAWAVHVPGPFWSAR